MTNSVDEVLAQSNLIKPKCYVCYRASAELSLDGLLNKPFWQNAPWTDDFVDIEGDLRPLPWFRTRVKMLWDDDFLYIGAELEEPHVWGTLKEHDAVIFQDNDFEVFIDPDGDNHNYYEIEINALNTTWDLRLVKPYRDGGPALNEWEIPGFQSAVYIDGTINDASDVDRGWSIEIALPWKALGEYAHCQSPPVDTDRWRINFSRVEWDIVIEDGKYKKVAGRPEHNWVWSPQGVIDMHQPERWGYLQFSSVQPGTERSFNDSAEPARELLMRLYHAQKAFFKTNGRWATTLGELSMATGNELEPILEMTENGYIVHCAVKLPDGTTQNWYVHEDSYLAVMP